MRHGAKCIKDVVTENTGSAVVVSTLAVTDFNEVHVAVPTADTARLIILIQ